MYVEYEADCFNEQRGGGCEEGKEAAAVWGGEPQVLFGGDRCLVLPLLLPPPSPHTHSPSL